MEDPRWAEDLQAHYGVGTPMTFEQMRDTKAREREMSLYNPFEDAAAGEANPYVFEDAPVGTRRFVVANVVGEEFHQRHAAGKRCMIKVRVSTASVEHARRMCESIAERDATYALYVLEMFKFVCLPPLDAAECDADAEMNEAIRAEYAAVDETQQAYLQRKRTMLDEVTRHNDIARRIAEGELDPSCAESAPVLPERTTGAEGEGGGDDVRQAGEEGRPPAAAPVPEAMEPDVPLCSDNYVVVATLEVTKHEKMEGRLIVKICGTFATEADATAHMKQLKKDMKYKLFDVTVCDMYAWLEMPPPYELIDRVLYDSQSLTDCLGTRKTDVNTHSVDLQCPADAAAA